MFTKLFDTISIRALANGLVFSALLLGLIFVLPGREEAAIEIAGYNAFLSFELWAGLAIAFSLVTGFIFSEMLNRTELIHGNYHLLVIFSGFCLLFLLRGAHLQIIFCLPLLLFIFYKINKMLYVQEARLLLFDMGIIAGLGSFLAVEFIFTLPVFWVLALMAGHLSWRNLLTPILGYGGISYLIIAAFYMFGVNLWAPLWENYKEMGIHFVLLDHFDLLTIISIVLLMIPALLQYPTVMSRANNLKRQFINAIVVFLLLTVAGVLLSVHKLFWAALLIFPLSILLTNLVVYLKNRWLRDVIYLLFFAAIALSIFGTGEVIV